MFHISYENTRPVRGVTPAIPAGADIIVFEGTKVPTRERWLVINWFIKNSDVTRNWRIQVASETQTDSPTMGLLEGLMTLNETFFPGSLRVLGNVFYSNSSPFFMEEGQEVVGELVLAGGASTVPLIITLDVMVLESEV